MQCRLLQQVLVLLATVAVCMANQPPRITNSLNGLRIPESTSIGASIGRMQAVDPEGFSINYKLTSDSFRINSRTGDVRVRRQLDYETATSATAVLEVNSFDDNVQTVATTVVFIITDVNDVAPAFTRDVFVGAIDESVPPGTVAISSVVATDRDITGPGLNVECDRERVAANFAGVCDRFEVKRTSRRLVQRWEGQIILRGNVSFSEQTVWQVPLKAFDGVFTTRASAEIQINDVQNQPPIFLSQMNNVLQEFPFPLPDLIRVEAQDQDNANRRSIRYSIISNPGNLFSINPSSGFISSIRALDRDRDPNLENGFVTIVIKAQEVINATAGIYGNDSLTTATATMVITVRGINDEAPTFSQTTVNVSLPEDSPNGSPLPGLTLSVSDADQGLDSEFELFLRNHSDLFEVHPTSGKELANVGIRVKDSSKLDYDGSVKSYTLLLVAREHKAPNVDSRKTVTCTINVNLVDVNDLSPVFGQTAYSFNVSELATAGTVVSSGIVATDGDSGQFGTAGIRYSLIGNGAERFRIADASKPVISVAPCTGSRGIGPGCIDHETLSTYNLFLVARDNLGSGNANSTSITINIIDENDNAPVFVTSAGFYEFFIDEGETTGTPVFQVSATDADSSLNNYNRVQYSLLGVNGSAYSGLWQVLSGGVITATRPVDFETIPGLTGRYELLVQAQDSAPPFLRSTVRVVINVNDRNDNAPVFRLSSPVQLSILEGPAPSRHLQDLVATDNDLSSSANGKINYFIQSGSLDKFTINSGNGSLSTTASAVFQFEQQAQFILLVVAEDSGRPKLQATLRVNVRIIDRNNKLPYFAQNPKRVTVSENSPNGSFVTEMSAIDQDASAQLRYSILSASYSKADGSSTSSNTTLFALDEISANVTVSARLDRDLVAEATLQILVTDTNATEPQNATASLIIVILDVNDEGPIFTSPWTAAAPFVNISMDEEEPIGSFVAALTATDPDGPIAEYRITSDPASAFTISAIGVVSLRGRLDFESIESTTFTVVAVDSGTPSLSAMATVFVTINNINDNTPVFNSSQYRFRLDESNGTEASTAARPNQLLGVVNATDADKGDFGRVIFSLASGGGDSFFLVNSSEGGAELYANGTALLDREARQQLVLQLQASDSPADTAKRRFASVPVYVDLLDVNDNAPTFGVSNYFATVANNVPPNTQLLTVSATDVDLNASLSYSLTPVSSLFRMNSSTGALTVAASLAASASRLTLTATVTDGRFSATSTIQITILESTSLPPRWVFPGPNDTLQLLEEQYRGLIIARLRAFEDNSSSSTVTRLNFGFIYEGAFTQETPLFRVNPLTGVLTANAIFDREASSQHLLNLAVRDQRSPPLEARRLVTVRVIDVDDNAPRFSQEQYTFSISEDAAINDTVGQVAATDSDSGENAVVRYEILSGNDAGAFRIDANSGRLQVSQRLDRERVASYSLRIGAASGSRSPGASVAEVNITIGDINDNIPTFSRSEYFGCVPYTSQFGRVVATVAASDPDYAENAVVQYRISKQDTNLLGIAADGRVSLVNLAPAASTTPYLAVISASNPNLASRSSSASVSVWFSDSSSESVMTLAQTPEWVSQNLNLLVTQVQAATDATQVFVQRVRNHQPQGGGVDLQRTDVVVSCVGRDRRLMTGSQVSQAIRQRGAEPSTAASLQFLRWQSAVTYEEQADGPDVSLPIVLSISVLAVLLIAVLVYAIVLFFMQRSLAARCRQQAGIGALQVLQIQGIQKKNIAYDNSAYDG